MKRVKVGWCVDAPLGDVVFTAPRPVNRQRDKALSRRAVQACPAVSEYERRLFELTFPFDLRLRLVKAGEDAWELFSVSEGTRLDDDLLSRFVLLMRPDLWRDSNVPVIQISIPYFFICDSLCYLTQLPPFLSASHKEWPGLLIAGRFRTDIWPRTMNWAFEWSDTSRDLILKRGRPMCYFQFEFEHPETVPELIYAEMTSELREYRKLIQGVPKLVSNTFSLFEAAAQRRPKILLKEVDRYEP
jgi:hypothetical protein